MRLMIREGGTLRTLAIPITTQGFLDFDCHTDNRKRRLWTKDGRLWKLPAAIHNRTVIYGKPALREKLSYALLKHESHLEQD